jgi:asparagine synthetase B (glutamine-hydrolysing)
MADTASKPVSGHGLAARKKGNRSQTPCARLDNARRECHFLNVVSEKYDRLVEILKSYQSCLVAYSGGVDSVFLAFVAHEVLGEKALAAIADSPSLPRRELAEATRSGRTFKLPVQVVHTGEFEQSAVLSESE